MKASELVGASPRFSVRPVSLVVRAYLVRHHPDGVILAVSGGADSLALAVCALDQAHRLEIPAKCVTVDHGLRAESSAEAEMVVSWLRGLGAEAQVWREPGRQDGFGTGDSVSALQNVSGHSEANLPVRGDELAKDGTSIRDTLRKGAGVEGGARELRYRLLRLAAREFQRELLESGQSRLPVVHVLTGHTEDDQAETVLLRLGRGVSAASLAAMRELSLLEAPAVYLGRPLLGIRRQQTAVCCKALGLTPIDDPTNYAAGPWRRADGKALPRAAIRERVLPALEEALGQDPVPALARLAGRLAEDEQALAAAATELLAAALVPPVHLGGSPVCPSDSLARPGGSIVSRDDSPAQSSDSPVLSFSVSIPPQSAPTAAPSQYLSVTVLVEAPKAVRMRAYRRFLADRGVSGGSLQGSQLEAIDSLVVDWHGQGAVSLPGGYRLTRKNLARGAREEAQ